MSKVMRAIDAKSFIIGVLSAVVVVMAMGAQFSISKESTRREWQKRGWANNVPVLNNNVYKPRTVNEQNLVNASKNIEVKVVKVNTRIWGPGGYHNNHGHGLRGDGINGAWAPFAVSGTPESPEFIYFWRVPDDT